MNTAPCIINPADISQSDALNALEAGKVLFLPTLSFPLLKAEQIIFNQQLFAQKQKNVSYDYHTGRLNGINAAETLTIITNFMQRFATFAAEMLRVTLPHYSNNIKIGRTSYRPAEIAGRKTSKRKDDTRLHVDAFPSTPVNGHRILRFFCNINPHNQARTWHIGESFTEVLAKFKAEIPSYKPWQAKLLKLVGATKSLRSKYDHQMLHIHDGMKLDDAYQAQVTKTRIDFPPQSCWFVYTDIVSHAALKGQYVLEQTFYLPIEAMFDKTKSPQVILNR